MCRLLRRRLQPHTLICSTHFGRIGSCQITVPFRSAASNRVKTGIVENNCLVREPDRLTRTIKAAGVAAPYVAIRNVMSAAGDPQPDTFYMQLWIAEGDVYDSGTVPAAFASRITAMAHARQESFPE
jgi:hypothetical protein